MPCMPKFLILNGPQRFRTPIYKEVIGRIAYRDFTVLRPATIIIIIIIIIIIFIVV